MYSPPTLSPLLSAKDKKKKKDDKKDGSGGGGSGEGATGSGSASGEAGKQTYVCVSLCVVVGRDVSLQGGRG